MFLKGFKRKSAQKLVKKMLVKERSIPNQQIRTLGVLVDATEMFPFILDEKLAKLFEVTNANISVLYYHPNKKEAEQLAEENIFTDKDLSFSGKLNNESVNSFVNQPFDALLNYYTEDKLLLNLVSVQSKAKIRIGLVGVNELLNDFSIKTELNNTETFISELKKYLPILNQI